MKDREISVIAFLAAVILTALTVFFLKVEQPTGKIADFFFPAAYGATRDPPDEQRTLEQFLEGMTLRYMAVCATAIGKVPCVILTKDGEDDAYVLLFDSQGREPQELALLANGRRETLWRKR